MRPLDCKLHCWSRNAWIQQIFTGLSVLRHRRAIVLSQKFEPNRPSPTSPFVRNPGHLRVVLENRLKLHFDLGDKMDICSRSLEECDFYFKRSMDRNLDPAAHPKVHPLGMNYGVFPDHPGLLEILRIVRFTNTAKLPLELIRSLDSGNRFSFLPRPRFIEAPPPLHFPPRVVFISRAWDPDILGDQSGSKTDEVIAMNEFRANCIRSLRKELGPRFLGGFTHTPYGKANYGDVIIPDPSAVARRNYTGSVRSCTIGVSTTGLHGSTPWKIGEYISLSMPIVSQPLLHRHPGRFAPNQNFLEFQTPDECVTQCDLLLSDRIAHQEMALKNYHYYQTFLRPDMLVMNALMTALSR